jgi:hypothetical protein
MHFQLCFCSFHSCFPLQHLVVQKHYAAEGRKHIFAHLTNNNKIECKDVGYIQLFFLHFLVIPYTHFVQVKKKKVCN